MVGEYESDKSAGGSGIFANGNVEIKDVSGQVAAGKYIKQIKSSEQSLSQRDIEELRKNLLDFQNGIAQLGLSPDYQNIVNGEISAAKIEAENEKPTLSNIKEKFESAIKIVKKAGKSIEGISKLYEPAKKIAKLLGIGLSFL